MGTNSNSDDVSEPSHNVFARSVCGTFIFFFFLALVVWVVTDSPLGVLQRDLIVSVSSSE